jgi:hypothetical protein
VRQARVARARAWVVRARARVDAWSGWWDRLGATRPGLAAPRVEIDVGARLPGAAVRLLPVALVAAVGALASGGTAVGVVLLALAAALVLRPALPTVAGVVLVAGLAVFGGPDLLRAAAEGAAGAGPSAAPPTLLGPLRLALLVVCLDAAVRVAALTPHVAWSARVEWSVLGRLGRSVLATQAVVQPLLWVTFGLRAAAPGPAGPEGIRLVALVAVAVVLVLLVPRRGRDGS